MTQRVESDLRAFGALGIDIHAGEAFGLEIEYEDLGLETDAPEEPLQMSATPILGAAGEIETEAGDITTEEAMGLESTFSSAFKQYTKAIKAIGMALDFTVVAPVGPPVLEFRHWGQTDVYFGGPEMNVPFYGLP